MESINDEPTQAIEDGCPLSLLAYDSSAALSVPFPTLLDDWLDALSITAPVVLWFIHLIGLCV